MSKVGKTTILLMIVTVISKFLGFARELVLTYIYGITAVSDAFITALSIPSTLFAAIGKAVYTTFIPVFYEVDKKRGKNGALKFTNNMINILLLISIVMSIIFFAYTEPLVKIFAISFSGEKLQLTVQFTKIMIFGLIFLAITNILQAWLQIHGNFTAPGMMVFPYNILIILGIIISSNGNMKIMAIGTLLGIASQFLYLLPFAIKMNYRYKFYINLKDEYIKKILNMIIPVFIGTGVYQINLVVDRSLASTLGDGYITVLNSANRLNSFVIGIFITTIATVIFPMLSKLSNEDNDKIFKDSIVKSINTVVLLIIPISVGAIVLSKPVVQIVFERGAFGVEATNMTAIALICYSIGMIGFALREILDKIFYSLQDTKTPMINGVLSVITNIVLNFILIKVLGYKGLALATSISSIICILLLFRSLGKKIGYFGQKHIIVIVIKSLVASCIMGGFTYISYKLLIDIMGIGLLCKIVSIIMSAVIGMIIYGLILYILKVREIVIVLSISKKILNYKKGDKNGITVKRTS